MPLSIVILTYNSEQTIENTLIAAGRVSDDIHVVDSFSTDNTLSLSGQHGAHFVHHEFVNYSRQRNWAIEHLPLKHEWELHVDADEILSEQLILELNALKATHCSDIQGYFIPRLVRFLGRPIRHGGMYPIWHMRLFRRGHGRCEDREYDQHFIVHGRTSKLRGAMIDDIKMPLREWVNRHNQWSDAEVRELLRRSRITQVRARLTGNPIEIKRYLRARYLALPPFSRALLFFLYRYLVRFGWLDGTPGLIFFVLQTFWFRFLIDSKLYEQALSDVTHDALGKNVLAERGSLLAKSASKWMRE
jgi:glycosyltransferase involved in cell wall biosynthesis